MTSAETFDLSDVSPVEALKMVMLSEAPFYCTNTEPYQNKNLIREYRGYLNELVLGDKVIKTSQFTMLDMDGDEVPEAVLAIEDYYGFIVLRYREGSVIGNVVGYRSMIGITKQGCFWQSGSAVESYISKLFFVGNSLVFDKFAYRMPVGVELEYYVHDLPTDEKTWNEVCNSFAEMEEVEWYELTQDAVEQWVDEVQEVSVENERQTYLDSLEYLFDFTYDYTLKDQQDLNTDAKKYYDSCTEELNKTYQLCISKLSGDKLEKLEMEQQQWQDVMNQGLAEQIQGGEQTSYYTYGDKFLRRTLHLVNLYYGYDFYN